MGNVTSAPIDQERRGIHVLKVKPNSPASDAGLESYFDFIIEVNRVSLHEDRNAFPLAIKSSVDRPVECLVYSDKTRSLRTVALTPRLWASEADGLLGCSIRHCDFAGSFASSWHVIEVLPNSPAADARLVPETDYIVGTPEAILREQSELYGLIAARANENKPVRLFVYSSLEKSVRETSIVPKLGWGGPGLIGAELAYGALHRIPTLAAEAVEAVEAVEAAPAAAAAAAASAAPESNKDVLPPSDASAVIEQQLSAPPPPPPLAPVASPLILPSSPHYTPIEAPRSATVATSSLTPREEMPLEQVQMQVQAQAQAQAPALAPASFLFAGPFPDTLAQDTTTTAALDDFLSTLDIASRSKPSTTASAACAAATPQRTLQSHSPSPTPPPPPPPQSLFDSPQVHNPPQPPTGRIEQ